jgi:hypothetical protein
MKWRNLLYREVDLSQNSEFQQVTMHFKAVQLKIGHAEFDLVCHTSES